jgi:hypothetical protein
MHHGAKNLFRCIALAAMICVWALAGTAQAVTYDLQAVAFTKTMPDGRVVTMWGYYNPAAPGTVADQFPLVLEVPVGDPTLTVNLTNNLTEFTSLQLSGFVDSAMTPVPLPGSTPTRYRSFTHEADANGGTASYTWTVDRAGTFLLQSASHVSVQVPMGLYAVVKKNFGAGQAYGATTAFQNEVIFLFSEVDPALNDAVAGGTMGSNILFQPKYFLINGDPFPFGDTHTYAGDINQNILVRFLNAGLSTRAPTVVGDHWRLVAEDGNPYVNEKLQFSLDLTPGKTLDIIGTTPQQGYFPIYDRSLGLTNADTSTGGMLTYLEVGPDHATGGQAVLTITKTGPGTGTVQSASLPGGIICGPLVSCSEHYLPGTELRLTAVADRGSVFAGWTGCTPIAGLNDCLLTLPTNVTVTASFVEAIPSVGVFRSGEWFLDKGEDGWQSLAIDGHIPNFGAPTDIPVAGDMNGDGYSEVGVYRPSTGQWFFDLDTPGWTNCIADGGTDLCLAQFGGPSDIPVTGDWDGNGLDEVGVYRQGQWFFDSDGSGTWDPGQDAFRQNFGAPTDIPVTGDWDGDGKTEIGTYRQGTWFIDFNGNGRWDDEIGGDKIWHFGASTDIPVTLDGNTTIAGTEIAVYRPAFGAWFIDFNDSGEWEAGIDRVIDNFGASTDKPVTGFWR